MNPVEQAVAPLKVQAVESAKKYAEDRIEYVRKELEAVGMDSEKFAPYPFNLNGMAHALALGKYEMVSAITRWVEATHRRGTPCIVKMDAERSRLFVKRAQERAAELYDAFVAKLVAKIGPCESATLEGSHVWGYSFLHIVKADGSRETWKTQQIANYSKYGKYYAQWPSRKLKSAAKGRS